MKRAARFGGGADGDSKPTEPDTSTTFTTAAQADLPAFRERLIGARRRLVERIAEDFPADRRFPDSGWTRMLADIQIAIAAVDAMMAEDGP